MTSAEDREGGYPNSNQRKGDCVVIGTDKGEGVQNPEIVSEVIYG